MGSISRLQQYCFELILFYINDDIFFISGVHDDEEEVVSAV